MPKDKQDAVMDAIRLEVQVTYEAKEAEAKDKWCDIEEDEDEDSESSGVDEGDMDEYSENDKEYSEADEAEDNGDAVYEDPAIDNSAVSMEYAAIWEWYCEDIDYNLKEYVIIRSYDEEGVSLDKDDSVHGDDNDNDEGDVECSIEGESENELNY
jgi:hypothetical protein